MQCSFHYLENILFPSKKVSNSALLPILIDISLILTLLLHWHWHWNWHLILTKKPHRPEFPDFGVSY